MHTRALLLYAYVYVVTEMVLTHGTHTSIVRVLMNALNYIEYYTHGQNPICLENRSFTAIAVCLTRGQTRSVFKLVIRRHRRLPDTRARGLDTS